MPRPRLKRIIHRQPNVVFYKPQGIPMRTLKTVSITIEEWEALRLKNVENLSQIESAKKMQTSQSTFQRIITNAQQKISFAIVNSMAIKIDLSSNDTK